MKKNLRLVSVAAAALLAVAPVATSVVPTVGANVVQAADTQVTNNADKPATGTPYFITTKGSGKNEVNTVVTSDSVTLKENTVDAVVNAIKVKNFGVRVDGDSSNRVNMSDIRTAVYDGLNTAGITVNNNGSFNMPANTFTVTLTATAANGRTASLPITVTPYNVSTDYTANPVITYDGKPYDHSQAITLASNATFNNVAVGGSVDTDAIKKAFTAKVSTNNNDVLGVTVDTSKVNTSVAGTYPVTVSARNANGNTTTLTFNITVGVKGAKYQTATSADGNAIPVYSINGNTVSQTQSTIANNSSVATFDTVSVNGTSYTRINSANANQFVLTSVFNKPTTPSKDTNTQTETVMVDSRAYDKSGNYLGHMYYAYDSIEIVPTVVTINGKTYYKVANKDEYVRVTNITGNQRTLRHNAYIYWSSYRRTPGTGKMYRGQTVTTYGPAMRFKNGKKYYRIQGCRNNNKRYIKAANFY